jgi:creatinine amidohydrolase
MEMKDMIVEYHKMRPSQIVKRRTELPVAYMGVGTIEWHGLHNPIGLDGLKANGIACYLAKRLGGIVMPTQYWGDNRKEIAELEFDPKVNPWIPPQIDDHTLVIAELMQLDKNKFLKDAERCTQLGGWRLWIELMVRTLFQIETLGFEKVVIIPGHYPLFTPLQNAIAKYKEDGGACKVLMLTDQMYSDDGKSGDHAAMFETSLMMALYPELVDINELGSDLNKIPVGVLGDDPRVYASKEFGFQVLKKFEEIVSNFIKS